MALNLEINNHYTFDTYAPAILGATIKNAKLEFSCNYEFAMKIENVDIKYRQIYPVLPSGNPESPVGVIFHRFVTESGEKIFIADPWIVGATLNTVSYISFTVNVVDATLEDKENVRKALAHLGVSFSIT